MADLNPLAFAVAIRDEATKDLNAIEAKLKSLKDQTITVKVEGLAELKSLLETLKSGGKMPSSDVGAKLAKDVEEATAALKREEEALKKEQDALEAMQKQALSAKEAISKLAQERERLSKEIEKRESMTASAKTENSQLSNMKSWVEALGEYKKKYDAFITDAHKKWIDLTHKIDPLRNTTIMASNFKGVGDMLKKSFGMKDLSLQSDIQNYVRSEIYEKAQYGTQYLKGLRSELKSIRDEIKANEQELQVGGRKKSIVNGEIEYLRQYEKEYMSVIKNINSIEKERKKALALEGPNYQAQATIKDNERIIKENTEANAKAKERIVAIDKEMVELGAQGIKSTQQQTQAANELKAQEEKVAQAKERVAKATQEQAQATQQAAQAQAQLSQKEIGTIAKNAVIEELKRSLGYISEAKEAIKNDSFTKFTERVNNATEAINKLTEAFGKFKTTIGGNQDLKDILSGWGAAIKEINAAMTAINAAKNAGGGKKKGVSGQTNEEIKQEEQGLVKVAAAIGRVRDAMASGGGTVNIPFLEGITRTGERNIQTLIKEQAHIERLIAIAQKSITFGEGHPVMGMNTLKVGQMGNLQDLEALRNKIREILLLANQGDQAVIRFLNTSGSLKTTPFGKDAMGNDITLLGGHFDKLTHSVTGTAQAMRTLNNEMRLDSNVWGNSERNTAQQKYNNLLVDTEKLLRRLDAASAKGYGLGLDTSLTRVGSRDVFQFLEKARQFEDVGNFRALNDLISQYSRLQKVFGEVAREQEKLNDAKEKTDKKAATTAAEKERKENELLAKSMRDAQTEILRITKTMERLNALRALAVGKTDTSGIDNLLRKLSVLKSDYQAIVNGRGKNDLGSLFGDIKNLPNVRGIFFGIGDVFSEASKGIREFDQAQKALQNELSATEKKIKQVQDAISRGTAAGRDMTNLQNALSLLEGKKSIAAVSTPHDSRFRDRLNALRAERETTDALLKAEEKLTAERERANKRSDNIAIRRLQEEEKSVNEAYVKYNQLATKIQELQALQQRGIQANINTTPVENYIQYLEKVMQLLSDMHDNNGRTVAGNSFRLRAGMLTSEVFKHNNILGEEAFQKLHMGEFNKELAAAERRMKAAEAAAKGLDKKIQDLEARKVDFKGLDTTRFDAAIQRLRTIQAELKNFANTGRSAYGSNAFEISKNMGLAAANKEVKDATKQLTEAQRENARATQQITSEQQRLSQALSQSTEHMKGQSQVLSDLKSLATQYLGVWGAQGFLKNIIEIGGQLEMQRLSIGAILQNQSQANSLFEQIKGMAVQSPFGVVQLDQMTKQLTAYGFKYHELYDWTKRLADISAATGTSVERLSLALGHVRSEAALSGYTLRQFSMGNVPLLQKLAEKLGKTTKEIREMVKGKEISYEDVVGVLKDLTDEGGMFHNMQEVVSQSVKAKFKNVKDAMDIMYGEMAEGAPGDALKGVAEALMELTRNWKDVATIMGTVGVLWGVHRAAVMLYTHALGSANAQTLASIAAHRQKEAAILREAGHYRTLTAAEQTQVNTSKLLTRWERTKIALNIPLTNAQRRRIVLARQQQVMDLALAVSEKKLTTEDIVRQVALGKLTKAQAIAILGLADLSVAEREAAIQAVNGTTQMGLFGKSMYMLGSAARTVGAALKSFLLNPAMLSMAAITAVMELWMRNKREMEDAEELSQSMYRQSQDAIQNTRSMMQSKDRPMSVVNNEGQQIDTSSLNFNNISGVKIKFPEIDKSQMQDVMDDWMDYIRNYSVNAGQILNEALFGADEKLLPLEERFKNLKAAMEEVMLAQYGLQDLGDVFGNAIKATDGGWFDENVTTDIKDYDNALRKFGANITATYSKCQKAIDKGIKAALKQDEAFKKNTEGMESYGQKFKYLAENADKYKTAWNALGLSSTEAGNATSDLNSITNTGLGDVRKAEKEMDAELETYYTNVRADLETKGVDLSNLTKSQQQALLLGYKAHLESIQGLSKETMDSLMLDFGKEFNIPVNLDDEKIQPKVNEVTETLDNLVEGDWTVPINFVENINNAIDEARKKYKLAKEFFEKTESIRLKFGISMKLGQLMDDKTKQSVLSKIENEDVRKEVEKVINGLNQASAAFNKATESSKNLGFSLEDPEKKKKGSGSKKTGNKSMKSQPAFKDEFAKRWDERIRIMQDAYNLYDKWEKKVGHDEAIKEVTLQYQKVFDEWSKDKTVPFTLKVENIENFREQVETYLEAARKRYAEQTSSEANKKKYNNGEEALRVIRTAEKLLSDMKFDNFTKAAEDFKSVIEEVISDLNERWDIFNTVREATSDSFLAARIADFGGVDLGERTAAGAMKNELVKQIQAAGGIEFADLITYDTYLDEQGIRKMLEDVIPNAEDTEKYKKSIESIIKIYQEWQRLQKQVIKDDISAFAKLIGSAVSYDSKIQKLNDDLLKQEAAIAAGLANGSITEEDADKAIAIAESQYDWEKMKLSAEYANIYNNAVAMSRDEYEHAAAAIEVLLKKLRKLGLISPEDYKSEREKLDKARKEWSESGFLGIKGAMGSFLAGGDEGLLNYYAQRIAKARENAERTSDPTKKAMYDQEAEHFGNLYDNLAKLSDTTKKTVTAFQTLQSGLNLINGLLEAAGNEGGGVQDASTAIGDMLSGAMSMQALGSYGMMFGAVLGAATASAKIHNQHVDRKLEEINSGIEEIDNTLNMIKDLRERELGYDYGNARRELARQYEKWGKLGEESGEHFAKKELGWRMYQYYSQGTDEINGYSAELSLLKKQQEELQKAWELEVDKKHPSDDALEEYIEKMAEVEIQIKNFTQDLAKELWDIDVKGWADQLSDALASAFENGESMAKAYGDTVRSILQSVMQKMMQIKILEPMFESLQDKLFGENGVFNIDDINGSMSAVTKVIGEFFGTGGEGERSITAATEFMTAFQHGLQSVGLSVLNESGSTLSSDVSGIKEETADLLAAYVNALRQDVAVNRLLQTQFVSEMWPSYIEQFTNAVSTLNNIDTNVATIRALLSENGALYVMLDSMKSHFDNITNGNERVMVQ